MIKGKLQITESGMLAFWCPGCNEWHYLTIEGPVHPVWTFDGNYDSPTFSPSILVKSGHYSLHSQSDDCWCTFKERFPDEGEPPYKCILCHSFVVNGKIQYLGDCSHELAGQTIDMTIPGISTES